MSFLLLPYSKIKERHYLRFCTAIMTPSILENHSILPHQLFNLGQKSVDREIFPDGIKTSGQHPPLIDLIRPYSEFPKEIIGETVWKPETYANNPERWVHIFSTEEIAELSTAADKFVVDNIPLTGISKASIPQVF
jgi:hypothetical protein